MADLSSSLKASPAAAVPLRVAIVADLLEERWPSMDLVAEMLIRYLSAGESVDILAAALRPTIVHRLTRLPGVGVRPKSHSADRVVNRFWDYPRWLSAKRAGFDVFHVIDHSYAHLVHVLPADRTVVTCHDIDAFLSLVDPERAASELPKVFARRIRTGMQKAARVVCPSLATREELHRYRILPRERVTVVYNGVHPECSPVPNATADGAIARLIPDAEGGAALDLLHVGSTIPRKRVDLLLRVVAAVRDRLPKVRLLKAGGMFTAEHREILKALRLEDAVISVPFLEPTQLAALYRRAAAVLVTSENEGFGLPVVEAMACGTPVVATDLPALREVGGRVVVYRPLGDIDGWRDAVLGLLHERRTNTDAGRRRASVEHAAQFRWDRYAATMAGIYRELAPIGKSARMPRLVGAGASRFAS